ncbi:MAG: hypothetical protein KI793_33695 [Rivularia sp. (in: Bacteria)]|nr:hypothetical protein [Rivularia sp. MS3]
MHYGFSLFGLLPQSADKAIKDTQRFAIDYTFWLNLVFLAVTGILAWLRFGGKSNQQQQHHGGDGGNQDIIERILYWLAMVSYIWLAGGVIASFVAN